ncbi:hypothetical protein [Tessaracoccus sp. OH4464_COT-324]|uniref:hypothetical protein n=1 Tax=Tessaracoccus sp. OH4464_COT-324 TaxID=2491059 RepID=UPI000F63B3B4|nr:hypothetical protein [Tessaracoccus sp. OH4464_COT-324]RRD47192.1 hypothetical protein EII42_04215 [Tessaracoccus sp. OH4464_COT-324]
MANPLKLIKTATGLLAAAGALMQATLALWSGLKENEEVAEKTKKALEQAKRALRSRSPETRFTAAIDSIESCVSGIETQFPDTDELPAWRTRVTALRMRGQLTAGAAKGRQRKPIWRELNAEAAALFEEINTRLATLSPDVVRAAQLGSVDASPEPPSS